MFITDVFTLFSTVINEPRVHQDVELTSSQSSAQNAPDASPFVAPLSPSWARSSSNYVDRTKLSWSSGHIPNVLDSPSLRGVVSFSYSCHRRSSPFPSDSLQRKRRRRECNDIDEETEDHTSSSEKYPRLSLLVDETSPTSLPKMAPILGQLLSNVDCGEDGKTTNDLVALDSTNVVHCEEIADSMIIVDCDIKDSEILVDCEKIVDLDVCHYDITPGAMNVVNRDVVTDSYVVDFDPVVNSAVLICDNENDVADSDAVSSLGLVEDNSKGNP